MYSTILITGGAGFVGSNLSVKLKADYPQLNVFAFDNLKRRGSEFIIRRLKDQQVEFVHGDIRNKEDLLSMGNIDLVVDCSAEPSVSAGISGSPDYLINTNLIGTINMLELSRQASSDVLFLSTNRIYPIEPLRTLGYVESDTRFKLEQEQQLVGVSAEFGVSEQFPLSGHRSLYGATKLASELLIEEYHANFGLNTIINRCGVIAGPWQMGKVDQGFMVHWVSQHMFAGQLAYFGYQGSGKQVRDVLHIDDLYSLVQMQIEQPELFNGGTFNVGGGYTSSTSLQELSKICAEVTGQQLQILSADHPHNVDIPIYITDHRKISQLCGWQPEKQIDQTVIDIYQWILDNQQVLQPLFKS